MKVALVWLLFTWADGSGMEQPIQAPAVFASAEKCGQVLKTLTSISANERVSRRRGQCIQAEIVVLKE